MIFLCKDNELMDKLQHGDKKAFETLVIKYRKNEICFANSFLYDINIAEDIVEDSFIKIYFNRMTYKNTYTFKTYLFTIVRNKCIDYIRNTKRHLKIPIENIYNIAGDYLLEDIVINRQNQSEVLKILNSLQNNYKTALYLFAVENMSYEQIANVMQKTIPQIKIIIFRARKKLRKICEEGVVCFEN